MSRVDKRSKRAKPKSQIPKFESEFEVEPLDQWLVCGPDTTVEELWKVVERRGPEKEFHLVFFDRHGWYCEHSRNCRAVAEVRRVLRQMSANAPRPVNSGSRKRK